MIRLRAPITDPFEQLQHYRKTAAKYRMAAFFYRRERGHPSPQLEYHAKCHAERVDFLMNVLGVDKRP